jgi:putative tricarboxylic transport membrane protein
MDQLWVQGIAMTLNLPVLLCILVGAIFGIICGALPGVTATMGIAVVLPFTYYLPPVPSMALLLSIWAGGISGASIPAVLLKIPGNPNAIATMNDGYPMAQKGLAGKALGATITASFIGGLFSILILIFLAPTLAKVALAFGPAEYFALGIFGLTILPSLSGQSIVKGLTAGILGVMVSTVGVDQITGESRFIFGNVNLLGGIPLIPVLIGVFAISQVIKNAPETPSFRRPEALKVKKIIPGWNDLAPHWRILLLGSVVGIVIGIIPGAGASIAVILAYEWARRISKNKNQYGTGIIEGILAPEAANNAVQGGALVPLLSLGIPGDASAAIMLGALIIHGYTPGPRFFIESGSFAYAFFAILLLANIAMFFCQTVMIRVFVKVLHVPFYILSATVIILSLIGSFAIRNNMVDVWFALLFGVFGYYMIKFGYSIPCFILGVILGPMVENEFRRALGLSGGNWSIFVTRPISLTFILIALVVLTWSCYNQIVNSNKKSEGVSG